MLRPTSHFGLSIVVTVCTVQIGGILAEALRLVMVQRILSSPEFKMDPLVSIYYYAPACAGDKWRAHALR